MISGRRAIQYLYCETVDLILLDVQMPVMDGVETLREIRNLENGATLPVIFLTAMKDRKTVIEGSKLGIMDYITKPFDVEDLRGRIEHVFKRLGMLPVSDEELIQYLEAALKDISEEKYKQAVARMDEIARYQVEEEIAGRMTVAIKKMENEDITSAKNTINRMIQMLKIKIGMENNQKHLSEISNRDLYVKLVYIREHIRNFKTKDAIRECRSLNDYMIPDEIKRMILLAGEKLVEYDDDEADQIISRLIERIEM
jgi:DNA-binding response OmpR family regulator